MTPADTGKEKARRNGLSLVNQVVHSLGFFFGSPTWARTRDLRINRPICSPPATIFHQLARRSQDEFRGTERPTGEPLPGSAGRRGCRCGTECEQPAGAVSRSSPDVCLGIPMLRIGMQPSAPRQLVRVVPGGVAREARWNPAGLISPSESLRQVQRRVGPVRRGQSPVSCRPRAARRWGRARSENRSGSRRA